MSEIVTLGDNITCMRRELQPVSEAAFAFEGISIRRLKRDLARLTDTEEVNEATYDLTHEDGVSHRLQMSLSGERMFLEQELAEGERVAYYSYRTAMVRPILKLDRTHMERLETLLNERAEVRQDNHVAYSILNAEGVPRLSVLCSDSYMYLGDLVHRSW